MSNFKGVMSWERTYQRLMHELEWLLKPLALMADVCKVAMDFELSESVSSTQFDDEEYNAWVQEIPENQGFCRGMTWSIDLSYAM
jgi:hypothetical protein